MDTIFVTPTSKSESPESRAPVERSTKPLAERNDKLSPVVHWQWAGLQLGDGPGNRAFRTEAMLRALKATTIPVLHLGADHDIAFPVENWYALSGECSTQSCA